MTPAELSEMDALEQVAAIADRSLTSAEAVDAAIAGAETVDPALNFIVHERYERARAEAEVADRAPAADRGPLHGVPVVVKDLDGQLAGEPYWAGSNYLKRVGYVATESSILFQRLIDAGAIIIAKTNTPELGLVPSTEPTSVGPCRNPWDLARSPGGSSGGSAAAVAAGVVALGHAGDGGGSIRIPAANCGLVGLKPSRDLVPTYPDIDPWGGLVARLGVTRTVADTALLLDVLAGPDNLASPQVRTNRAVSYLASLDGPVGPMRIAWTTAAPGGGAVDPAVADAVAATAELLAEAGHDVVEATPGILTDDAFFGQAMGWFLDAFAVWVRRSVDEFEAMGGEPVREDDVEAHTWALHTAGGDVPGHRFAAAVDGLMRVGREVRAFLEKQPYDVLLTPTCPEGPWTLGGFEPEADNPMAAVMRSAELVTYATPFNISGQPAISLPVVVTDGLPIGVQLVGRWGRDDQLLALGGQLEERVGWQHRRPPTHVATP